MIYIRVGTDSEKENLVTSFSLGSTKFSLALEMKVSGNISHKICSCNRKLFVSRIGRMKR